MSTLAGEVLDTRAGLIRALVRQAQRYHFASLQDKNLVVAARHNAYAVGILGVVTEQSSDQEVYTLTKVNLKQLRVEVSLMQDNLEARAFRVLEELRKKGMEIPD